MHEACRVAGPSRIRTTSDPGGCKSTQCAANSLNRISGQNIDRGWKGNSILSRTYEYIINGNIQGLNGNNYGTTPFGNQYPGLNTVCANSLHSIEPQTVSGLTAGQPYMLTLYIANLDGASAPNIFLTVEYNAIRTDTSAVSGPSPRRWKALMARTTSTSCPRR